MKEFFTPPQKKYKKFSTPPQAGLQIFSTPLTSRPPPYCWIKNDQPSMMWISFTDDQSVRFRKVTDLHRKFTSEPDIAEDTYMSK